MSGQANVPEEAFRVDGHCCAATLPGIRDGDTAVDFAAGKDVQDYLAVTWGIGRDKESEGKKENAESRPEGRPDEIQSAVMANGAGPVG